MNKTIYIEGMSCEHCVKRVEKALNNLKGVSAKVSLADKKAEVTLKNDVPDELLKQTIEDIGYEVVSIK